MFNEQRKYDRIELIKSDRVQKFFKNYLTSTYYQQYYYTAEEKTKKLCVLNFTSKQLAKDTLYFKLWLISNVGSRDA